MNKQGYQLWRVPETRNYAITVASAQGGDARGKPGFSGRIVKGVVRLRINTVVSIVVGQRGGPSSEWGGGGGGGGSFVAIDSTPIMIAGGGGGYGNNTNGSVGIFTNFGTMNGGTGITNFGAAGGGFTGRGQDTFSNGGGSAFIADAVGGAGAVNGNFFGGFGGFGGGGGGTVLNGWSGGGGGGFGGGNGAVSGYDSGGAGGTSYGSVPIYDLGTNTGDGYVIIEAA